MNLSQDIIEILKNNNLLDLNNLKQITREDLKNMNFIFTIKWFRY